MGGKRIRENKKGQFGSVTQSCLTLCDLMDCSMPGFTVHHQTDPDLPVSVQESPAEMWVGGGWVQGRGHWCSMCAGPSEGGLHYLHHLHHSLASGQATGREQLHPSTENWIRDLLSMARPSEQDPVSLSVSLSHQEASITLLSLSIRGNVNHNHRKLIKLITWTTALSNSMKPWAMLCKDHPRWTGHGGEFWENVVHWRREWQMTSTFLPWEPHETHEEGMVGVLKQEIKLMRAGGGYQWLGWGHTDQRV